ncbi:MAG: hypothetical protein LBQ88_12860, partial [Treponema sp.]|nr:hypothetical protein [Treponema sp.]
MKNKSPDSSIPPNGGGKKDVIKAGWAKLCFEVPAGVPLAGYGGEKPRLSTGIGDPLYIRAL